ncbi:MAG TPA: hypothetical protein VM680_09305 [Verrucomicrobiae bacterium]|nr:hypothetical protein [Verrucomicrobiae bacterium]
MITSFKKLTLAAAFGTTLLLASLSARAGDAKAVPPANNFVVLLEGTFQRAGVVADFGLQLPNLNNGKYQKVPFYHVESGVPGPNDPVVGTFYALGGEGYFCYDLGKGALTAMMIMGASDTETIPDGEGGVFIVGTYELDILEATGIYRSFLGGHIHMVDNLHVTAAGTFVEHCFCFISKPHGKR